MSNMKLNINGEKLKVRFYKSNENFKVNDDQIKKYY